MISTHTNHGNTANRFNSTKKIAGEFSNTFGSSSEGASSHQIQS
jgi:hypothetical protein